LLPNRFEEWRDSHQRVGEFAANIQPKHHLKTQPRNSSDCPDTIVNIPANKARINVQINFDIWTLPISEFHFLPIEYNP
ncbi:MAG: hypothetical protein OEQ28_15545, partial [Acidobacteriota bacterium]|nr:hypothetical protein [Acidobacteriota bacterium]